MKRLSRIEKYLDNMKYTRTVRIDHAGGPSFYNDGYALYDVYDISKGDKTYTLKVKITGRAEYRICNEYETIAIGFSQRDILKYVIANKDMYGNILY